MYQPPEIRLAINSGLGRFKEYPLQATFAVGQTDLNITPPSADIIWQVFVVNYGELDPSAPTSNFYFVQKQIEVKEHNVPMVHSVMDFPYPVWMLCTQSNPLVLEAHNNTGAQQTLDIAYYLVTFDNKKDWAKWISDLISLGFNMGLSDSILNAVGLTLSDFNEVLAGRSDYWITRHGLAGPLGAYYRLDQVVSRLDRLIQLLEALPDLQGVLPGVSKQFSMSKVLQQPTAPGEPTVCPAGLPEEDPPKEDNIKKVLKWPGSQED